jgi:serine/threonine protein kinase
MHGRYTILRKIADGGMAEIFLGTQHGAAGFERPVVLKCIRSAFVADAEFRNVLIDEAHVAMGLNHSNIVQVLDLGSARGLYFLVLELVDGWDLYELLRRATAALVPLPLPLCLHVTAEICRALAFAHARTAESRHRAVVHRDVSPHNILVSQEGEVKLTDFGIATAGVRRTRTAAGIVKGKVGFMSPEQTAGEPLDKRSDIYSLGSTLYLMVTGRRPFEGATDLETMLLNRDGQYPPVSDLRPDLPPAVVHVVEKALQHSPADRYASADAMLADLERVLRTAVEPAGQTELKQWLSQLAKKDGAQPVTKAPQREMKAGQALEGEALQLDEIPLEEPTDKVESGTPDAPHPEPEPKPEPAAAPPVRPVPRPRTRRRKSWLIGLASAAALGAAGVPWALGWLPRIGSGGAPREQATAESSGLLGALGASEAPEPAAVAAGVISPDASSDSGAAGPGQAAGSTERNAAKIETVAVQVLSTPPGAFVSVGRKVFGSTPLHIRFRADAAYDLVLEKDGYSKAMRRLYVTRRRGQVVSVTLQKKRRIWPSREARRGAASGAQAGASAPGD